MGAEIIKNKILVRCDICGQFIKTQDIHIVRIYDNFAPNCDIAGHLKCLKKGNIKNETI